MELDKLSQSIDLIIKKLKDAENQVDYLRQRESNLLGIIKNLQTQSEQAQAKIQHIISRLKTVEEHAHE